MTPGLFQAFYNSQLAHPFFLWMMAAVAALTLSRPKIKSGLNRFEADFSVYFRALCLLAFLDAWLTSNLVIGIGELPQPFGKYLATVFVVLGDFRFFFWMLVSVFYHPSKKNGLKLTLSSLVISLAVPVLAQAIFGNQPELRMLFLGYESMAFLLIVAMHFLLRNQPKYTIVQRISLRAFAMMYFLWAASDSIILFLKQDWGYALRLLPNGIYYGGWIAITALAYAGHERKKQ